MKFVILCAVLCSSLYAAEDAPPITVDPQKRAQDYSQAFDMMRKEKTSNKVVIHLTDGTTLTNIIEMGVVGNGTLLHFKTNSPQGIKIQIVEVEKIHSITHL
jgi:hypothetical protein